MLTTIGRKRDRRYRPTTEPEALTPRSGDADDAGYLQVRGLSLATGYWSRDAAIRAAFQGEWLTTCDVYTRSVPSV